MSSNNRISNFVNSQVPFFVRNDHRTFVSFLEAYYEYLEQSEPILKDGKAVERSRNLLDYFDIDRTLDDFTGKLYSTFLNEFPDTALVDKKLILKHAKDLYRAKGTEKSIRFLLRALFGKEIEIYYPKKDILRASDGKWYIQRTLRLEDIRIDNTSNTSLVALEKFIGREVKGRTSNALSIIERADRFFEGGTQIDELTISSIRGSYDSGETIITTFTENGLTKNVSANIVGEVISSIVVNNPGSGYITGTVVPVISNTGSGAIVTIGQVSSGRINSISVTEGGAGYQIGNDILITGGGTGAGAAANVSLVLDDSSVHPNSYNIVISLISAEANTVIGNTTYSNLNSLVIDPANNWIQNTVQTFVYGNTGPARAILVSNPGAGYSEVPSFSVVANTRIAELGILGRLEINNGGEGYLIDDEIHFTNVFGGYGTGALAKVSNVGTSNTITEVEFVEMPGHLVGGSGYDKDYLPIATVVSSNGNATGANVSVVCLLGDGASFFSANSTLGAIRNFTIINRGRGYTPGEPTLNLSAFGDGTAQASITVAEGLFTYEGRYLNDDGFLSSSNYLEDRDYYQNYSYVIRIKESLNNYKKVVRELFNPSGMNFFGEYLYQNIDEEYDAPADAEDVLKNKITVQTYTKTANLINVTYISHNLSTGNNVTLEFASGGYSNVKNGIYNVVSTTTDTFNVKLEPQISAITINDAGALYNSNSFLIFTGGGGSGANAKYTTNANGSIISVVINDFGRGYTSEPTVTANGSNSTPATFNVTLLYANNTSGSVNVGKILI